MKYNRFSFYSTIFIFNVVFGIISSFFGPILLEIGETFQINLEKIGVLIPIYACGMFIGILVNLFSFKKKNKKLIQNVFFYF